MAAAVVAHRHGEPGDLALECIETEVGQGGVGLDLAIEVGHVGTVMTVVVDRHRGGIDGGLQGLRAVGQRRQAELGPGRRRLGQQHQHQGQQSVQAAMQPGDPGEWLHPLRLPRMVGLCDRVRIQTFRPWCSTACPPLLAGRLRSRRRCNRRGAGRPRALRCGSRGCSRPLPVRCTCISPPFPPVPTGS